MISIRRILNHFDLRKNIFACLFSAHNTISLSRLEQVCLIRLRFERCFSHHLDLLSSEKNEPINIINNAATILTDSILNIYNTLPEKAVKPNTNIPFNI